MREHRRDLGYLVGATWILLGVKKKQPAVGEALVSLGPR
jgi:hypothetical protein